MVGIGLLSASASLRRSLNFGHHWSFSRFSFINNWLFWSEISVKYIKLPTHKVIFDKWIEVHWIYRKCAIITWTQLVRCISMGPPIHSHCKKMNVKHRGRRIWKACGTAKFVVSTPNCCVFYISPLFTLSVTFVQNSPVLTGLNDPSIKVLQIHMCSSIGICRTFIDGSFNSVNTGLLCTKVTERVNNGLM